MGQDKEKLESNSFALNRNFFDPDCVGLDGVIREYKKTLKQIEQSGNEIKLSEVLKSITEKIALKDKNTDKA